MLRYLPFALFACLVLLLTSCEKENFDIIDEAPETVEPTVIETEDAPYISLRLASGETLELNGRGFIDENGFIGLTTSSSSDINCVDQVFTLGINGNTPGFFLAIATVPETAVFLAGGVSVENFAEGIALYSPECSVEEPVLEITTLTEDRLAGTFTAEFFVPDVTNPGAECENLVNLGSVVVDFNVELIACN